MCINYMVHVPDYDVDFEMEYNLVVVHFHLGLSIIARLYS